MSASRSVRWVESRLEAAGGDAGVWLIHRGGSMAPALREGDRLRVVADPAALRRGDIALVRRGALLVAHRVVDVRGARLVTRGDAVPGCDPALPGDGRLGRPLGRVVEVERHGRRFPPPGPGRLGRALARLRGLLARGPFTRGSSG